MKSIYEKLLFLLLMFPLSMLAQSTLQGTIIDSRTKQSIPGVNVNVQGSTNGTSTDFDGKFKISKLKSGDKIIFSFIGYKNETIDFTGQSSVSVQLNEDSNKLQEVVVQVGYGNVKKKDATGSVTTISTKDFNKGANVSAENLLNGRVAGVTINSGGGAPGSGSQIRIRGGSSLAASNDPLIVIDGLPLSSVTNEGSTSILAALNPNDIESFNILKDASATAIYGSRASNGVIIITTKRGGKKLSVDYNFQYGSGSVVKTLNVLSANEYRNLVTQKYPGSVGLLGNSNTEWQKEIYRRTDFVDNNIAIKGNLFGKIPARVSIGNTYQEGLRLTNYFNRTTVSTSLSPSFLNDHLKLKINATFTAENNRFADEVERTAISFNPTQPIYDVNSPFSGFFEYYTKVGTFNNTVKNSTRNPVAQLLNTNDLGKNNRVFGNFEIDYKFHFLPALRAVVNVGFDQSNGARTKEIGVNAATAYLTESGGNQTRLGNDEYKTKVLRSKLFDAYLVYNTKFGKANVELTGGYSYQKFEEYSSDFGNSRVPAALLTQSVPFNQVFTDNIILGYFGRANITYNDRFLLTLTARRDGSSVLPKENRYLFTPGVGFAYKITKDIFKESKTISDLKLRLGWGVTGQSNIGNDFNERSLYLPISVLGSGSSQYTFGNTSIPIALANAYNPFLKWEQTTTSNAGLDFGLFGNRLTGSVDIYLKKSKDQFQRAPVPDGASFTNILIQNNGEFETKGIEVGLNGEIIKTKNINWNLNFNFTRFERRISKLAFGQDIQFGGIGAGIGGTVLINSEGFTPGSFYVFNQTTDPNTGLPVEGGYSNLGSASNRYIYKNADPDAVFGFASTLNAYHFDFSFNLRASIGNRLYNSYAAANAQYGQIPGSDPGFINNIPTSVFQTQFTTTSKVILSDIYVENASYLRMDNITLGYTFPKWLEGKASLRLFSGVQNAFVITKYSGIDPEVNGGIDNTIYPRQRQILFGANVKF